MIDFLCYGTTLEMKTNDKGKIMMMFNVNEVPLAMVRSEHDHHHDT